MKSKITDERKEKQDEKKSGTALDNTEKLKQLYDKTAIVKKKYDSVNNAKNKISKECGWFERNEVRPISTTQKPPNQTAANTVSQSATNSTV